MRGFWLAWMVALLALGQAYADSTGPPRRALLIGNTAYRHLPPVPAAAANVEILSSALSQTGFQPLVEYDLTQDKLLDAVRRFAATIRAGDFVFVYFSGYGYGIQEEEVNYLLPVSFDPKDDRAAGQKAVSLRLLLGELEKRSAGTRMIVLDASRPCPGLPEGLTQTAPVPRTLIGFAAAPNQAVADPAGKAPNPFTAALAKAIQEPGATPGGVLGAVQSKISEMSTGAQMPFVMPSPVDAFYFVPPKPVVVADVKKPGQSRENPKDGLLYVWIPAGLFKMGCVNGDPMCLPDEKPLHDVKISHDFWMTKTEVTAAAYERFAGETGRSMPPRTKTNPKLVGSDLPITKVSWEDAKSYCTWAGGRLPTEAEWEYAARGGREGERFPWGNTFDPKRANSFKSEKLRKPYQELVPVRRLGAGNGFELYDMAGNAQEWVADYYDPAAYAAPGPFVDPTGPAKGAERVIRGGSFNGAEKHLRTSVRYHREPSKSDNETGFRCVLP